MSSVLCEQGEKHSNSHSQEVEVSALSNCMLGKPVSKPCRSFICAEVKPARRLATSGQRLPKLVHSDRDWCTAPGCSVSRAHTCHLADSTASQLVILHASGSLAGEEYSRLCHTIGDFR